MSRPKKVEVAKEKATPRAVAFQSAHVAIITATTALLSEQAQRNELW